MEDGMPTKQLDLMYMKLLRYALVVDDDEPQTAKKLLQRFRQIVGAIVTLFESLTPGALATLLGIKPWKVERTLESLSSVLGYYSESQDLRIRVLHPSFRDFLLDKTRCDDSQFGIVGYSAHRDLAASCFDLMSGFLRQDICSLALPGSLTSEVDRCVIQRCLPQEVQYACRYWVDHLQRSNVILLDCEPLYDRVHNFLREHLLHWLEALSLMGNLSEGVLLVRAMDSMLTVSDPTYFELCVLVFEDLLGDTGQPVPVACNTATIPNFKIWWIQRRMLLT